MFELMFVIVPVFILGVFIFVFLNIFSPKFRGRVMSNQIKSLRHMSEYSREDLNELNGIAEDMIKRNASAVKAGLNSKQEYCQECGRVIDADSRFCKHCGKKIKNI